MLDLRALSISRFEVELAREESAFQVSGLGLALTSGLWLCATLGPMGLVDFVLTVLEAAQRQMNDAMLRLGATCIAPPGEDGGEREQAR